MSQTLVALVGTDTITASRTTLNSSIDALLTQFSGTAFPASPKVGQTCYRTDQQCIYLCKSIGPSVWYLQTDLTKTVITQESGDARWVNLSGSSALLPSGNTAARPASPSAGMIRHNSETGKFEGYGVAWAAIGEDAVRRTVATKTAGYTVGVGDLGMMFVATGSTSWTLALPAVASVGNGFFISLRNAGTGLITIDPNGTQTVNGATTLVAYHNDCVELVCDGTAWHALFQSPVSIVAEGVTANTATFITMPLPTEFERFELSLDNFASVSTAAIFARFSTDGGATYYSGAGAYAWCQGYFSTATAGQYHNGSSGVIGATGIELGAGNITAQAGIMTNFTIRIDAGRTGYSPSISWVLGAPVYSAVGSGYLGVTTRATHILIGSSSGNLNGGRYKLLGVR